MATPYKTFSNYTFGCKVNFADSSYIGRELIDRGYSQVPIENFADISLINTCSVTENADRKARKLIKSINNKFPETKIIVYGCYAQLKPDDIMNMKGVSCVVGDEDKFNIGDIIDDDKLSKKQYVSEISDTNFFNISYSLSERVRAFVKIQDGCGYNCSYCTIPNARGKSRSFNIKRTIKEIRNIVDQGSKEIVLSDINIGDFGYQYNESLAQLLEEIELIKDLKRYRISSIEPNLLDDQILEILSSSNKAMPHLHIPLQSGSDKILKLMKRRYSAFDYSNRIKSVKKYLPNACIGVDTIVGFPGESDEDFNKTYQFLKNLDISYLHVFSYSERDNTSAKNIFPKIQNETTVLRRNKLRLLSNYKYSQFIKGNIDHHLNMLFEQYNDGILSGWTDNYIRVNVKGSKNFINTIKKIKITNQSNNLVNGVFV